MELYGLKTRLHAVLLLVMVGLSVQVARGDICYTEGVSVGTINTEIISDMDHESAEALLKGLEVIASDTYGWASARFVYQNTSDATMLYHGETHGLPLF